MSVISFDQEAPPCIILISKDCEGCRNLLSVSLYLSFFEKLAHRLGIPKLDPTMLEDIGLEAQKFFNEASTRLEQLVTALRMYLTCIRFCLEPSEVHLVRDEAARRQICDLVREAETLAKAYGTSAEEGEDAKSKAKRRKTELESAALQSLKMVLDQALAILDRLDLENFESQIHELRQLLTEAALGLDRLGRDDVVLACTQVVRQRTGKFILLKTREVARYLDELARLLNQVRNAERWYKLWLNARKVIVNPYSLDYKIYFYDTPAVICLDHVETIEAPSQPAFRVKEKRGASYEELARVRIQLRLLAQVLISQVIKYRYRRGLRGLGIAEQLEPASIEQMYERLRGAARRLGLEVEDWEIAESPRLRTQLGKLRKEIERLKKVERKLMESGLE